MIKLYDELMKNRELTKNAQFVFCLLDDFYKSSKNKNKHGEKVCRIKSKDIQALLNISQQTVVRAMKALSKDGYIEVSHGYLHVYEIKVLKVFK